MSLLLNVRFLCVRSGCGVDYGTVFDFKVNRPGLFQFFKSVDFLQKKYELKEATLTQQFIPMV